MVLRTADLKKLETAYQTSDNNLFFVYGRIGCDKENIFKSLSKGKNTFYYRARQCSDEKQLELLKSQVVNQYSTKVVDNSYDGCFSKLKTSDGSKILVIIDEAQNIIKKNNDFLESLIKLKNHKLYPGRVMVIVSSSSIVWSQGLFLELAGTEVSHFNEIIKLNDMSFLDVVRAFPEYSVADCVSTYGILGGVSSYLNRWDGSKSIKDNIVNNILSPDGYLFSAAEDYISTELRELTCYNTILASIASGNEKLNDLYEDTGYSRAKISVYMKNLGAFDVIDKAVSFETGGWDNTKKGVYRISDHFIHFWFTFVYPNLSELYTLSGEEFYDKYVAPGLDSYLQLYFENVCREYLHLLNMIDKLPIKLEKIGTWIGKEGTIDIIGQNSVRENVVGICNWSEAVMPYDAYDKLVNSMKKARISADTKYLFSATKFDVKLVDLSKSDPSVVLVDMTEL